MASDNITTFTLTPGNPCNTTITSPSGDVLYRVHTEFTPKTITHVKNASDEELGSLEWRETLSDRVTIKGGETTALSSWMHKSHIPFKEEVSFKDDQARKYKWKGSGTDRSLELYCEDDKYHEPIARYTRTYRKPTPPNPETGKPGFVYTPGELALLPRALDIQDLVVLSLLFHEKQIAASHGGSGTGMDPKATVNVGAGIAVTSAFSSGGY